MDRWVTPPMWVTSPTRGPPPPCKEALECDFFADYITDYFLCNQANVWLVSGYFPDLCSEVIEQNSVEKL